jgi:phosphoribosylanthranilate isomerase
VVYIGDESAVDRAIHIAPYVDALHLDSLHPHPTHPQLGGTGVTHDWQLSRRIVESVSKPVILAGGLHSGNVQEAIEAVRPYAVDVCTGVRDEDYHLIEERLAEFVSIATKTPTELPRNLVF